MGQEFGQLGGARRMLVVFSGIRRMRFRNFHGGNQIMFLGMIQQLGPGRRRNRLCEFPYSPMLHIAPF
jgi:hypothetical protein